MTVALLALDELAMQHDREPIHDLPRLVLRQVLPQFLQSNA